MRYLTRMPDRLTTSLAARVFTITVHGDEPLTLEEILGALSPIATHSAAELLTSSFAGFTPGHFLGWDAEWWWDVLEALNDATQDEDIMAMIEVGRIAPSPERLAELLSNSEEDVRELAQIWMLPRI